ncbi:MAG: hypothetical protein PVJ19_10230, partial [Desulfobacteraceae bacterium]
GLYLLVALNAGGATTPEVYGIDLQALIGYTLVAGWRGFADGGKIQLPSMTVIKTWQEIVDSSRELIQIIRWPGDLRRHQFQD